MQSGCIETVLCLSARASLGGAAPSLEAYETGPLLRPGLESVQSSLSVKSQRASDAV